MAIVEVKFVVADTPILSNWIRDELVNHQAFNELGRSRVIQIWKEANGPVPNREKLTIDVNGVAVSLMDDWQCTIFAKSHLACLPALFAIHRFLTDELQFEVTIDLLEPSDDITDLISRQKWKQRLTGALLFIAGAVVSALIGWLINLGV